MSKRQKIPPMRSVDRNVGDVASDEPIIAGGTAYDVYSWSPGKAGEGVPSTEVHLVLKPVPGVILALRLKSARALDELVGVLLQHRADVWPQSPTGEG